MFADAEPANGTGHTKMAAWPMEQDLNIPTRSLIFALTVNIVVLAPVILVLLVDLAPAEHAFGAATEGRLILTSIYSGIAIVSALLIVMHLNRLAWAIPMTVALFAVQIIYKLITVPVVGLSNPVVITNLAVVVVQLFALTALWQAHRRSVATV